MGKTRRTVMILGAGVMQLPALRIARRMGWKLIVADANPRAPGVGQADIFEQVDLKDREKLRERAAFHARNGGLDGVFTAGTDFSASVAYVAESLGLPGIPYETALNATDKSRMRRLFRENGVPSPDFRSYTERNIREVTLPAWTYPVVVKPVDNMGARGVEKVMSPEELRSRAEKALSFSRSGAVIVEEFIPGPEFSLDALVYRGKVHICGIADRHIFFPPYFVELGHTMPTRAGAEVAGALAETFRKAIAALGIRNGAAKGDIFYSPRGPMVGEVAARLSGGYMSGWTFPYSSGVEVTRGALNIAVGLPPGDLRPRRNWTSAERAFISIPGRVEEISGMEAAEKVEGVRDLFLRVEKGALVKFPENNLEKCGNIITALPDPEGAVRGAEDGVSRIFLRLSPGEQETEDFLFGSRFAGFAAYPKGERSLGASTSAQGGGAGEKILTVIGPFRISAPPYLDREERDWNHRSVAGALDRLSRIYGEADPRPGILGVPFWKAFFRGGIQGAAWVLDTLAAEKDPAGERTRIGAWERKAD